MLQPQSYLHVTWRGWQPATTHLPEGTPHRAVAPQVLQALTCLTGAEEALQDVAVREQDSQGHLLRSR